MHTLSFGTNQKCIESSEKLVQILHLFRRKEQKDCPQI